MIIRKFPSVTLSEILSRFWCFLNFSNRLGSFCVKNRKPLGSFSTPKSKKLRYQLQLIKTPLIHLIIHCMHVFTIGRVCRKVGWLNLALGAVMTTWWNQLLVPLWSQTSCSKQTVCLAEVVACGSLLSYFFTVSCTYSQFNWVIYNIIVSCKAAGPSGIIIDMLKAAGNDGIVFLRELITWIGRWVTS